MSAPFPHRYETTLVWEGDSRAALSSGIRPVLVGGPPPEFDGEPGWWSPEHLLISAANLCLMTTYMVLARKSRLPVAKYRSDAEGILEKTKEGIVFTRITLRVAIVVPRQTALRMPASCSRPRRSTASFRIPSSGPLKWRPRSNRLRGRRKHPEAATWTG